MQYNILYERYDYPSLGVFESRKLTRTLTFAPGSGPTGVWFEDDTK